MADVEAAPAPDVVAAPVEQASAEAAPGLKPPSPGKMPTPPASAQPHPPGGAGSIVSKLSSLKERRSTTTPQQPPASSVSDTISTVPEHDVDVAAAVPAQPTAKPTAQPAAQPASQPAAPAAKPRAASSRVPSGAVDSPVQPSPGSKIPSMSPQRMARPGAADSTRSAGSAEQGRQQGSPGSLSPLRDGGWNQYSRDAPNARAAPTVTGPSDEERAKRRLWAQEKRRKEEARLRGDAARRTAELERKRTEEEARLEARRAFVRERIAKQHEIQARMAAERANAEERARSELSRFKGKPLHERLIEQYEEQRKAEEEAKKRQYEEDVLRVKHVRPHQIIAGEVVIKPSQSPMRERDVSAGRTRAPAPAGGAAFSPGRHFVPSAAPTASRVSNNGADYSESPTAPASQAPAPRAVREKPRTQGMVLYSTRAKAAPAAVPGVLPRLVERAASPFIFNSESAPLNVPEQTQFWPSKATAEQQQHVPSEANLLSVDPAASYEDVPAQASPAELSPTEHAAHEPEESYDDDGFHNETVPGMEATLAPSAPAAEEPKVEGGAAEPGSETLAVVTKGAVAPEVPVEGDSQNSPEADAGPEAQPVSQADAGPDAQAAPQAQVAMPSAEAEGAVGPGAEADGEPVAAAAEDAPPLELVGEATAEEPAQTEAGPGETAPEPAPESALEAAPEAAAEAVSEPAVESAGAPEAAEDASSDEALKQPEAAGDIVPEAEAPAVEEAGAAEEATAVRAGDVQEGEEEAGDAMPEAGVPNVTGDVASEVPIATDVEGAGAEDGGATEGVDSVQV